MKKRLKRSGSISGYLESLNETNHSPAPEIMPHEMTFDRMPPPLPPTGSGPTVMPTLLPNEVLLHQIGNCLCKFEPSRWIYTLKRRAQLECRNCVLLSTLHPELIIPEDLATAKSEADYQNLRSRCHAGVLYLSSERLIFVPRKEKNRGFSLFISKLEMLRVVQDQRLDWYFVGYSGENIVSVACNDKEMALSLSKLIANVCFEQKLRGHLTPEYHPDEPPSYSSTQESIARFIKDYPDKKLNFKSLVLKIGTGADSFTIAKHNSYEMGPASHPVTYWHA